jgi:hypothetical protein
MKRKLFYPFLLIAVTCLAFVSQMDGDPFEALLERMKVFNKTYAQEKVHLHLDKPYYAVGDNIWFKAYIINTENLEASDISKILYVELINEKDSLKKQLRLPVGGGITWGDFKLPDSLAEGNYRIRAYTQWMRNAGPEFYFDKTIKIGNSWANTVFTKTNYTFSKENSAEKVQADIVFKDKNSKPYAGNEVRYEVQLNFRSLFKGKALTNEQGEVSLSFLNTQPSLYKSGKILATITLADQKKITKEIPIKATSKDVDVQFFPESGNLVEGLPNKIAFKAVNASGLGEQVSGVIVDQSGSEINRFESKHLGMGNFVLNPQPGATYNAKIKFSDGSEKSFGLPVVRPSGYILSVNNTDKEKLSVKIIRSEGLIDKKELKLVGQHSGTIQFTSKVSADKQISNISISKKELTEGILQLTLFSGENVPLAERLVFVHNQADRILAKLETVKTTYAKRENVTVNLSSSFAGQPNPSSFSVSVTNTSSVKPDPENESNIFSTMLLSSDLIGYIEKPNYYFINEGPEVEQNLDNLMLTQGWRRILWKNVINNTPPITRFAAEKSQTISGTITNYSGKPAPNSKVSLFSSSGGFFALDTLTDAQGRFNFDQLIFPEDTKFIIQARTAKDKKRVDIHLDVVPGQIVTKSKNSGDIEINVNEALSAYLQQSSNYFDELNKRGLLEKTLLLKEVQITEKKQQAKNSANLNGAGRADAVITAEQLSTCVTLSQCLQGRVAGLMIMNGQAYLSRNGGRTPMAVILDGMSMGSDFLDNINVMDVETIEVLKSIGNTAIYGSNGGGGVLVITTKRGGGNYSNTFSPGITTYNPRGFYIPREFYSPKYEPSVPDRKPDLRTTVYWAPQVPTNEQGKSSFSFFNTDETGTYRVVLEGMDHMGRLGRAVYTYEVK